MISSAPPGSRRARSRTNVSRWYSAACHSAAVGSILVVDDEQSMREFLAICLRRAGHSVVTTANVSDALTQLRAKPFDVVVTDLRMPGELDGLGLLKTIKGGSLRAGDGVVDPEVILVTAYATADSAIAAMK